LDYRWYLSLQIPNLCHYPCCFVILFFHLASTVSKLGIDLPVSTIMAPRVKQSHRVAQAKIRRASAGQKPASPPASPPANPPEEVDNNQNEGRFVVASLFVSYLFLFLSLFV